MTSNIKRIIIHHTGGTYKANSTDKNCYHYIIENDGTIVKGVYKIEDNINCQDGKYAAHTKLGNTGSIGIALACNKDYTINNKVNSTGYPPTIIQYRALIKLCVELMKKYQIDIKQVWTHYEWDKYKKIKQGKSDITYLPFFNTLGPDDILNRIKTDIKKQL